MNTRVAKVVVILILFAVLAFGVPKHRVTNANAAGGTFPSLRAAAQVRGIRVGVNDDGYPGNYFKNTIPANFDSVSPGNKMNFLHIHPCPPPWLIDLNDSDHSDDVISWVEEFGDVEGNGIHDDEDCYLDYAQEDEWEWDPPDGLVGWAGANNVGIYITPLIWFNGVALPGWMQSPYIDDLNDFTVAARQRLLKDHVYAVITRYCNYQGKKAVYAVDVVNEAIRPDGEVRVAGPWDEVPNHLDVAFHEADRARTDCSRPEIDLFYNDFGFEYGDWIYYDPLPTDPDYFPPGYYNKANEVYDYLANLVAIGTPIDGIGFQTHLAYDPAAGSPHNSSDMMRTMSKFINLGLEVKLTELDIMFWDNTTGYPIVYPALPAGVSAYYPEQGDIFGEVAWACILITDFMQHQGLPGGCTGITTWGTNDEDSWRVWWAKQKYGYTLGDIYGEYLDPLLFWDREEWLWNPSKGKCTLIGGRQNPSPQSLYCPKDGYYDIYTMLNTTITWSQKIFLPLIPGETLPGWDVYGGPYPPPSPSEPLVPPYP